MSKSVDVLVAEAVERAAPMLLGYISNEIGTADGVAEDVLDAAGFPALVEALSEIQRFVLDDRIEAKSRLNLISGTVDAALGGVRVSGRAELEARLVELQGAVDRAHSVMASSAYVGGPSERDAWQEAMCELGSVATQHQGVDGETTTTKGQ